MNKNIRLGNTDQFIKVSTVPGMRVKQISLSKPLRNRSNSEKTESRTNCNLRGHDKTEHSFHKHISRNQFILQKLKNKGLLSLFLTITFFSCSGELDPGEYVRWMESEENNLQKVYTQGELKLSCQYMTPEYSTLKQFGPDNIDETRVYENIDGLSDLIEFKLRFERKGKGSFMRDQYTTEQEYNTRSMYLGYDIRDDLKLIGSSDTSFCILNHHERTYGNTPYETVLIAFPKESIDEKKGVQLVFDDRVFGYGRVKFHYSKDELSAIPKLKI